MQRFHAMKLITRPPAALALLCGFLTLAVADEVVVLEGAWASDVEQCSKVFLREGGRTVLSQDSDQYGGGFSIEGNRITGKMARCTIKQRKDDGNTVHMLAACATDIMYSSIQFSVKVRDKDSITRIFPGMDEVQINYQRCPR
jgi:hypothetical protein